MLGVGLLKHGFGFSKYAFVESTRDSTGVETHTIGFRAKIVLGFAVDATTANQNWSIGFDDGTDRKCLYLANDNLYTSLYTGFMLIQRDGSNYIYCGISSITATQVSLTWSETGVCACKYFILAFG